MDPRWGVRIPRSVFYALLFVLVVVYGITQIALEPELETNDDEAPLFVVLMFAVLIVQAIWLSMRFSRTAVFVLAIAFFASPKSDALTWISYASAMLLLATFTIDMVLGRTQQQISKSPLAPGSNAASEEVSAPVAYRSRWLGIIALAVIAATTMTLVMDGNPVNLALSDEIKTLIAPVFVLAAAPVAIVIGREYWVRRLPKSAARRLRLELSAVAGGPPDPQYPRRVDLCTLTDTGVSRSLAWVTQIRVLDASELTSIDPTPAALPLRRRVMNRLRGFADKYRGYPNISFQAPVVIDPERRLPSAGVWPIIPCDVTVYGLTRIEAPVWARTDNGVWCELSLKPRANVWRPLHRVARRIGDWERGVKNDTDKPETPGGQRALPWFFRRARVVFAPLLRPWSRISPILIPFLVASFVLLARWLELSDNMLSLTLLVASLVAIGFAYNYRQIPPVICRSDELEIPRLWASAHIPWELIAATPHLHLQLVDVDDVDSGFSDDQHGARPTDPSDQRGESQWESGVELLIDQNNGVTLSYGLGTLGFLRSWEWDPQRKRLDRIPVNGGREEPPLTVINAIEHWFVIQYANARTGSRSTHTLNNVEVGNRAAHSDNPETRYIRFSWRGV